MLLDHLTWHLGPGDRVGVVGVNGSGKTSLLRLLVGELAPSAGKVVRGVTVRPAYLSQDVTELDPALRVLEAVEAVRREVDLGKGRTITATQMCERFGFVGNAQWTPVGELSGGERRRLQLLRLLMDEPNVLLLDEPTNDLDIDTLTALEDLLDGWAGHAAGRLARPLLPGAGLRPHGGPARRRRAPRPARRRRRVPRPPPRRRAPTCRAHAPGYRRVSLTRPRGTWVAPRPDAATLRAARKELARLDRQLQTLGDREARLHDRMTASASDHEAVLALDADLRALHAERTALEERWLELAELTDAG